MLLAPLLVLLLGAPSAQAAPATDAGGGGRARGRPVAGDGAEPDADHDLHRRVPAPSTARRHVSVNLDPGGRRQAEQLDDIILLLTVLSVAPALLLMMTSFTKIFVVLALTRNALGLPAHPAEPGARRAGPVPQPVHHGAGLSQMNDAGVQPYLKGEMTPAQAFDAGVQPLRTFMLKHTREEELALLTQRRRTSRSPANAERRAAAPR